MPIKPKCPIAGEDKVNRQWQNKQLAGNHSVYVPASVSNLAPVAVPRKEIEK